MFSLTSPLVAAVLAAAPAAPVAPAIQDTGLQDTGLQDTGAAAQQPEDPPIPDCGEMQILPSGLRFCVIKEGGDGGHPRMGDIVKVDYTGWNLDGTVFDTSRRPRMPGLEPQPAEFPVGGLIDGWNEALQLMSPGDQWKIYVPSKLGYGETGSPPKIAANADLIFELELHEVLDRAPAFVAWDAESEGIETLESGVMMRTLAAGSGAAIPDADLGLVKFACYNPAGGFVFAHTTQGGGPLMLSQNMVPIAFMKDALPRLKTGARVQVNVPAAQGIGARGAQQIPNLPQGSNEIWILECVKTASFTKPEFEMPADDELTTTESGLKYKILREGEGRSPAATDTVFAHYAGWLTDGTGFDNSYDRGQPSDFALNRVIRGWTEGLQLLKEGGAAVFVIPSELGYGKRGASGTIPPDATLVFHVELVLVK